MISHAHNILRIWENELRKKYGCSWQSINTALYSDSIDIFPPFLDTFTRVFDNFRLQKVSQTSCACLHGLLTNLLKKRLLSQHKTKKSYQHTFGFEICS